MKEVVFDNWNDIGQKLGEYKIGLNVLDNIVRTQKKFEIDYDTCFSKGQLISKAWLCDVMNEYLPNMTGKENITICGGWYGVLAPLLTSLVSPEFNMLSIDIDPQCEEVANAINSEKWHKGEYRADTENAYYQNFTDTDIIINTSCEHLQNVDFWLKILPKGKTLVLQSNNFENIDEHISCSSTLDDFVRPDQVSEIHFKGTLTLPAYKRFMVICTK